MASKQHTSIFDRLTDSKLYTGAHKHRFDENGNGRGLAGRDRVAKGQGFIAGAPGGGGVADLSQITRTNLQTTGAGYLPPPSRGAPAGTLLYQRTSSIDGQGMGMPLSPTTPSQGMRLPLSPTTPSQGMRMPLSPTSPGTPSPRPGSVGRNGLRSSYSGAAPSASATRSSDTGQPRGSIFDRLNDPSSYTGMHKNRFSSDGRGRGAVGRTTPNAYVSAMDNVTRR